MHKFPIPVSHSLQGFIQRGGGGWNSFPLTAISLRNLDAEYGYYCGAINFYMLLDIRIIKKLFEKFVPGCIYNVRGSKLKIFLGAMPDPASRHAHLCVH